MRIGILTGGGDVPGLNPCIKAVVERVIDDGHDYDDIFHAFDTARAFVMMEQEGQIFGYHTEDRGASFKPVAVDTTGRYPRMVYEHQSDTVFACYTALSGVRVRVRGTQRRGVHGMAMNHTADVGTASVHLGVEAAEFEGDALDVGVPVIEMPAGRFEAKLLNQSGRGAAVLFRRSGPRRRRPTCWRRSPCARTAGRRTR
jgi:hypothetical protein